MPNASIKHSNKVKKKGVANMKLLLSDGTQLEIKQYQKGVAELNGDRTDAIILHLTNIPLERVKELFSVEGNLDTIEIYSDQNVFADRFNGYQIRKSISVGEEDNSYTVTLVKGTQTSERVAALKKDVETMSVDVEHALAVFKEISDQLNVIPEKVNQITEEVQGIGQASELHTEAINKLTAAIRETQESFGAVKLVEADRDDAFQRIVERMNAIDQTHTSLTESLSNAIDRVSTLLSMSEELKNHYIEKTNVMEEAAAEMRRAAESAGETATYSAQTADKAKQANAALEEFKSTLDEQNEKIESGIKTVETTKEEFSQLNERVVALEPVTDITRLPLEDAKRQRVLESQAKLADFLKENPVKSTCHGGREAFYSITAEKQSYLQSMILMATTAATKGLEYQPSWNAVGEPCTYDWTVDELQQLAIEIEQVVRPSVSRQQLLEKQITECTTMDELVAIDITFSSAVHTGE